MADINASTFSIASNGDLRQATAFVPGTSAPHTTLELHKWLQDLADNAAPVGDDTVSILGSNPSELAGKRNASRPMALTLLNGVNINDATAQWFQFGSIEQASGAVLYTGLKSIGTVVAASPIYIIQNASKVTKYWSDGHIQILLKAKTAGALIDSGNATVYSRKYGQTYSHFDVSLAAGGEQSAALSTALDTNVDVAVITPPLAAGYFSTAIGGTATPGTEKIALAFGDTTQDLGGGQGALLHKGTLTLNGTTTLAQAYQALMWACSELSTITLNAIPGFRYRLLNVAYAENSAAPFGAFAGGKWFVAQGYWLTGVMAADSKNYQLISHTGVTETPPNTVTVSVSGVVSGDYVLVARDNAGDILSNEYTVSASAAATSVSVPALKADTPASGVIRIGGDRYTYTSWTGTTVSGLSPAIKAGGYTAAAAFIPMIDAVASGVTITSAAMQFGSNFTCRYRVRNGGASPVVPFESTLAVTSTGGSGTAVRNADE
ncbi:MAG: hypothetical protein Q8N51_03520 [Gammaproteobacteria bacterium]|nr:hypothetical protein [Gammaproteobacteria bacterium]